MSKIKEILFVIITVMIIGIMCTAVNATNDGFTTIVDEGNNMNTLNTVNDIINNTNTQKANNLSNNTNTPKVNNTINTVITNTNSLPKAGTSQTISLIVIGIIFGISSLYAYRKINEYKTK